MSQLSRVFLGLGSNLGDRLSYLRHAVKGLPDVVKVSPVYETEPMGGPADQPEYLNCVVELRTRKTPQQILAIAQRLERDAHRERAVLNGPRTLDIDILLVDDEQINDADLQVPHPRMWDRRFVTAPLIDIAEDLVPEHRRASAHGEVRRYAETTDWIS